MSFCMRFRELIIIFHFHYFLIKCLVFVDADDSTTDDDVESLRSILLATDLGETVEASEAFQSSVCSPVDERFQRQCFSELPADRYEILEGSLVRMRCRVARQRGKAQWRAHNTLLGYDRDLRNWPRYSMQGDADAGEHDLVISSVSREDAGNFECQVSPTANQPLLRRSTNISVLVVPSKPIILAPSGDPQPTKNGQLIISRQTIATDLTSPESVSPDDTLRLVCQAKGGIPSPSFEWFHNGLPVRIRQADEGGVYGIGGGADSSTSLGKADDEATLVLRKTDLTTGDRLTCLVSNKATQRATNMAQQKLLAEIIVTVQTPPGAPIILSSDGNIVDSIIKNEGDSLSLLCQSKPPGSPPGELIWRWEQPPSLPPNAFRSHDRDATSSSSSQSNVHSAVETLKLLSLEQFSRHVSNRNQLESHLVLPSVERSQNGLSIVCVTRHKLGIEQKTGILLNVKYALGGVCISKSEIGTSHQAPPWSSNKKVDCTAVQTSSSSPRILHVHPQKQQIFSCSTAPFFGHATIKWFGSVTANDQEWHDLSNLTSIAELKRGGTNGAGYIKTVSLRLPPINTMRIGALQCRGYSSVNVDDYIQTNVMDHVVLKPYEAPLRPVIRVESKRESLEEGDILKLTCEATDGEPEGKLSWLKATRENPDYTPIYLISTTEHDKHHKRIFSNLDIVLAADDHLSSFKCASFNLGFPISESQMSTPFHVNLTFRPKHIRVDRLTETQRASIEDPPGEPPKSITVTAGDLLTLVCTAGPANPPVPLQWRQIICDEGFTGTPNALFSLPTLDSSKAPCSVLNNFGDAKALPLLKSRMVSRSQVSLLVQAHHHESLVECSTLDSDRPAEQPTWASQRAEESTRLQKSVHLNVLFKPNFSAVMKKLNTSTSKYLPQLVTVEGASVDLDVKPASNPRLTSAKWFHRKFDPHNSSPWLEITDQMTVGSGVPTQLKLPRVTVEHMGSYKLTTANIIGNADLIFFLNVTYAPRLIGESLVNATTKGGEAELQCQVRANPTPKAHSVYWRRLTEETTLMGTFPLTTISSEAGLISSSSITPTEKSSISALRCNQEFVAHRIKYYVKCFTPEPYHLVSTLYITDVEPSDVGRYECFVDNGIGSPVVRFIDLIYPFAPRMLEIDRWKRAAPPYDPPETTSNRTQLISGNAVPPTSIVCVIASEPAPTVSWFREPTNLTLVQGGQFKSFVRRIHTGRYRAVLSIEFVRQADFGNYFCQASNNQGSTTGKVVLGRTTSASKPGNPKLIKTTSTALTIGWQQGFNGGPPQTFIVKWAIDKTPGSVQTTEVKEDPLTEVLKHTIENLSKATTYRIYVCAKNDLHKASPFTDYILATTSAITDPTEEAMRDEAMSGSGGDSRSGKPGQLTADNSQSRTGDFAVASNSSPNISMIVTIAICFGCLIFITNLIIVGLVLHRRHQRKNSKLKRIPGTESLVKCGVMDGQPASDCYPDGFLNGQNVFGAYIDSASQKDSISQYQFEHFGQCSPQMPAEYISSNGSYFPRESPLNLFGNSPTLITTAEQHASALHHQAQQQTQQHQQRFNSYTMSHSSSPLHSSRSHGRQLPTSPSSLDQIHHLPHQILSSFTTGAPGSGGGGGGGSGVVGVYPPDQSIYLVAAPNPHRYMTEDPLGTAAAAALYGGMQIHHPGTVSPHSLTDKSFGGASEGRDGTGTYGSGSGRLMQPGQTAHGLHSSPRMITSFYSPPRADIIAGNAPLRFGQGTRRNSSSFGSPNRGYAIEHTTLGRSPKRVVISFPGDGHQPSSMQVTDMDNLDAAKFADSDMTLRSDLVATIPPPTDFGLPPPPPPLATNDSPSSSPRAVSGPGSTFHRQRHFEVSQPQGVEWLGSPSRLCDARANAGLHQTPSGVHFDPA